MLFRVILPLLIMFGISLAMRSAEKGWGDFFTNLSTEILGIFITVVYIDWIIAKNQKSQWEEAEAKIAIRLRMFIDSSITSLRHCLGYSIDILDESKMGDSNPETMHQELVRVADQILIPTASAKIKAFDHTKWQTLMERLKQIFDESDKIVITFGDKLMASQYSVILELHQSISDILQVINALNNINSPNEVGIEIFNEKLIDFVTSKIKSILELLIVLAQSTSNF